jgi:hypothetical protein
MAKRRKMWQALVDGVKTNDSLWSNILSEVLTHLARALASTKMKGDVIAGLSLDDADTGHCEGFQEGWRAKWC